MERSNADDERIGSEVAMIGMAGRFPGAASVEQLWENLKDGVESISFFTEQELLEAGVSPAQLAQPGYVPAAPVLEGVELFDAALFDIPPHEARLLDPQHRLFLEIVWEALERAGCDSERYPGLVGLYAGLEMNTYLYNLFSQPEVVETAGAFQFEVANDKDYLATRASYKLSLRGPSLTVQSACSTSLVAVHLACQALLSGECDMALAGGVALKLPAKSGYMAAEGAIQSPDGHCRPFDARAQGTVFGSGAGVVVLKRLNDALADGDLIHAVIRGSAINNDGSQKAGYSAPGGEGQYQVVRAVHHLAEIDPETITYIEAHGTGTAVGDPIEVAALTRAFRAGTEKKGFCAIGSVKSNVGHLRSAAGVTGLIKTVLALRHRQIPPSLHFERPNPLIDFANSPFFVNDRLREWSAGGMPLRAGVSSFGVGGTNAHVIVEEPPAREPSPPPARPWQLLVLSAHTATALAAARTRLAEHLRRHPELPLADVAWTLQTGRSILRHRGALVCRSPEEAAAGLEAGDSKCFYTARQDSRNRPVVFLFPGQGSQHPGMAREIYQAEPTFRAAVDRCCEILRSHLGLDLREVLFPQPGREEDAARRLEQTALAQPALFTVEHSLAGLWLEWGIRPRAMLGHSLGEYVAACLAGVFSLEDTLALVAERGRLMQSLPAGAMLSVPLSGAEVEPLLGSSLALAAVNGPERSVVSGPREAVEALAAEFERRGTAYRLLHTSRAFHSPMMEPILALFTARVAAVRRRPPELPFVSNLTGTWITAEQAMDPGYWSRHLRGTVRFGDGLRTLSAEPEAVLLEVGPGQALASLARQSPDRPASQTVVRSLPHPKEAEPDGRFLTGAAGQLWLAGVEIDWQGFHARIARQRVELPAYPFERQRFWVERRPESAPGVARPDVRKEIPDWFYVPSWKPSVLPEPEAGPSRWLLLGNSDGLAGAMARRLREQGHAVTLASRLRGPADHADRIVHFGCLEEAGLDGEEIFHDLLGLAQELGRLPGRAELRVVTCGLQAVGREVVLSPDQATVLGPVRVLPLEHPNLGCAVVDVEPPNDASRERLVEILIAEALAPADAPVVAWRGEERWVERFDPVRLPAADPARLPLCERGVYLITGGLGGLGLTLARELAQSFRARLVLTGRTLRAPGHLAIRELEELGAEVLALAADVTDEGAMRDVVRRARERFGPLQGAIHAAGVPGGGVIQLKTAEAAARVLAPKVRGARVLADVLAGEPLDLLVFCSSTYALTGGVGQVDYCAANSFLDAFARHLAAERRIRAVSLGWGAWREVGMAVDAVTRSVAPAPETPVHPLLDRRLGVENGGGWAVYETLFSTARHWVLAEHRLFGTPTLPGTTYLEMARAAFADATGARRVEIRDVAFTGPLLVVDGDAREVRTTLEPGTGETRFRIASRTGAAWQEHAHGGLRSLDGAAPVRLDLTALRARCGVRDIEAQGDISSVAAGVVSWGPRWQSFQRASLGASEALVTLELPSEHAGDLDGLALHPALLDVATAAGATLAGGGTMLPHSYDRVEVLEPLHRRIHAHVRTAGQNGSGETLCFDVTLLDDEGWVLVDIGGFTLKRVAASASGPGATRPRTPAGSPLWIAPTEGVDAFRRVLSRGRFAQVAVSPTDLPATIVALRREAARRVEPQAEGGRFSRPDLETDYAAPGTPVEAALAEIWQTVLGLERVGVHDNFFDLGGDSVVGIQLAAQAAGRGLRITPEQLFEHQTIAALARTLAGAAVPEAAGIAPALSARGEEAFSPLDFPEAGLSQESLDRLLSKVRGMS